MCIRDRVICKHKFYTRISNLTSTQFNNVEMDVLNRGLKYNIPYNSKSHIIREIISAEAAVKTLPNHIMQNEARVMINNKLNKYIKHVEHNKPLTSNNRHHAEIKTLKQIKNKLSDNNAFITKADKGNTIVVMDKDQYTLKVNDFINNNNIEMIQVDPTAQFVKILNNIINRSTCIFDENTRRALKPIKAVAPQFVGLPKIHKPNVPIRPLVNFTTAPSYKISKILTRILKNSINLKNNHSIKNNIEFINKMKDIKLQPNYKIASFDIVDLYTNIPVRETLSILKANLIDAKICNTKEIGEIINLLEVILSQNYFTFNTKYYICLLYTSRCV